ncbi:MAG: hypothetical protein M1503_04745 [Thaumarchaeota archaeon]|nr:hypothetical protein [Nitrososphaerota archaeon]MCL5317559.1 hypothetical protein [Nitrososphaerota archaeon]
MPKIDLSGLGVLKGVLTSPVLLMIISAIIIIVAASEYYEKDAASNVLCTTCHSMTPFKNTLLNTPHASFSCYTCHKTGVVELTNEAYKYVTVNPLPSDIEQKKLLLRDQCLTCHTPSSLQANLKLHKIHWNLVEQTSTCTFCHTSHTLTPPIDACLGCHGAERSAQIHQQFHLDANKALGRGEITCANCHSTNSKWMIPLNRPSVIGAAEGRSCLDCHTVPLTPVNIRDRQCLECHGRGH